MEEIDKKRTLHSAKIKDTQERGTENKEAPSKEQRKVGTLEGETGVSARKKGGDKANHLGGTS